MTGGGESAARGGRSAQGLIHGLGLAAGFAALSVAMTWPLAAGPRSTLPAGSVDVWQNLWTFWWWKTALLERGQSPFEATTLFFPAGARALFHAHSPINMILALPATATLGPAAAYNICLLAALTFSGMGAYALSRELGAGRDGSILAGLVFAFFPQRLEHTLENLNLFSTELLPFAVLFLLRTLRHPGTSAPIGLGVAFAGNALLDWHLGLLAGFLLLPLALVLILHRRPAPAAGWVGRLALAAAVAAALTLPVTAPLLREIAGPETYYQKPPVDQGIDPVFLLLPSDRHLLLGRLTAPFYAGRRSYWEPGFVCYLGLTPLVLAGAAVARRAPGSRFWAALLVGLLILALGRRLLWAGRLTPVAPLPFALLAEAPILSLLRVANRFLIPGSLALAVLVGLGASALARGRLGWNLALGLLILFEYLPWPYPVQAIDAPPIYGQLAGRADGAVLHVPFTLGPETVQNMVAQTFHGQPIAGGYLSTTPPEAAASVDRDPVLSRLQGLRPQIRRAVDVDHLARLGFGLVILAKDPRSFLESPQAAGNGPRRRTGRVGLDYRLWGRIYRGFEAGCGSPIHEDDRLAIFELPRPS